MLADEFIRELHEIRVEVQIFAAIQSLARLDADRAFQSLINRIDEGIIGAQEVNIQDLIMHAKDLELNIEELNTDRGRYYGAVLALNGTAILASFKSKCAHIIINSSIQNMTGPLSVGSHINVIFKTGKCDITIKRRTSRAR